MTDFKPHIAKLSTSSRPCNLAAHRYTKADFDGVPFDWYFLGCIVVAMLILAFIV